MNVMMGFELACNAFSSRNRGFRIEVVIGDTNCILAALIVTSNQAVIQNGTSELLESYRLEYNVRKLRGGGIVDLGKNAEQGSIQKKNQWYTTKELIS